MSKRDILLFLFRRRHALVGCFLLIAAVSTIVVYILPKSYLAKASLLIESNRAPAMRFDTVYGVNETITLNSEIEIIWSRPVLSAAVERVGYGEQAPPRDFFAAMIYETKSFLREIGLMEPITPREGAIKYLIDNMDVEPVVASNIINISLSGEDPKWLTDTVNAVTDSFIEHHLRIYSSEASSRVYRRQADLLKQELDTLNTSLNDYKTENNIYAIDNMINALVASQNNLAAQVNDHLLELAELETRYTPNHPTVKLKRDIIKKLEITSGEIEKKLRDFEQHAAKIAEMEINISSLERAYLDFQKRYEEARMNDVTSFDIVNVRVVEYAEVPSRPEHSRIFYLALALAGGLILTIAIALIIDYFDHRVSDPNEIEALFGAPVLGWIEKV